MNGKVWSWSLERFAVGATIRETPRMVCTRSPRGVRIAPSHRSEFRCKKGYVFPERIWRQLDAMDDKSFEDSVILELGMN